jgi:hypothetical protein
MLYTHSQATIIIPTTTTTTKQISSATPWALAAFSLSFPQLGFLSFSFLGFSVFLRNFC